MSTWRIVRSSRDVSTRSPVRVDGHDRVTTTSSGSAPATWKPYGRCRRGASARRATPRAARTPNGAPRPPSRCTCRRRRTGRPPRSRRGRRCAAHLRRHREVDLDTEVPAHVGRLAPHLVEGTAPLADAQAGLLLDLAGEALEERLALLDHAPPAASSRGCRCAGGSGRAAPLVAQDEPRTDDPVTHGSILADGETVHPERREGRAARLLEAEPHRTPWSAAFSSTRSARIRLGRMFSRRLGRLMFAHTWRAVAASSSSSSAAK